MAKFKVIHKDKTEEIIESDYYNTDNGILSFRNNIVLPLICVSYKDVVVFKDWFSVIEIVEIAPTPLFENSYGTKFFKGDECWSVQYLNINKLAAKAEYYFNNGTHVDTYAESGASKIMTERECHRYLDENWDKLNKK